MSMNEAWIRRRRCQPYAFEVLAEKDRHSCVELLEVQEYWPTYTCRI